MITKYTRRGHSEPYIAAKYRGMLAPYPSWFEVLKRAGSLRFGEEGEVEVRTITGNWRLVENGDYVAFQRNGDVWHMEADVFEHLFEEMK